MSPNSPARSLLILLLTGAFACASEPPRPTTPTAAPVPPAPPATVATGPNFAAGDKLPWAVEALSTGHATFAVVAITSFRDDPSWSAFDRIVADLAGVDGLVVDLRGNTELDPSGRVAKVLGIDKPVALLSDHPVAAPRARRCADLEGALAWLMAGTEKSQVVAARDYVVADADRDAESIRLGKLGIVVRDGGPVLAKPWAEPLTRRSFVVPQRWLGRKGGRLVYAPALAADLDALESVMSRAYGGWEVAEKRGFDFKGWFSTWRGKLAATGPRWMPIPEGFSAVTDFERFQLDNHTTIPLSHRVGAGSHTLVLRERPAGSCDRVRSASGEETPLDPNDRGQAVRAARRFDGEAITPAWYLALPRRSEVGAVRCGGVWIDATAVRIEEPTRAESIAALSGQAKDKPGLRHVSDAIAYLRFPTFSKANSQIIERELDSWDKPTGKERALIVDLRGNEGGDAALGALRHWIAREDIQSSAAMTRRIGASCSYPALRWGYGAVSSIGLPGPLSDAMRGGYQRSFDALLEADEPACPRTFVDEPAKPLREPSFAAPRPRAKKPAVIVVVDNGCGSDCEMMAVVLGKLPESVLVGVNTYGVAQYIQPGYSVLPNTRLPFRIALGTSNIYGDDRSVDGHGIDVDVVIDQARGWSRDGLLRLAEKLTARRR